VGSQETAGAGAVGRGRAGKQKPRIYAGNADWELKTIPIRVIRVNPRLCFPASCLLLQSTDYCLLTTSSRQRFNRDEEAEGAALLDSQQEAEVDRGARRYGSAGGHRPCSHGGVRPATI